MRIVLNVRKTELSFNVRDRMLQRRIWVDGRRSEPPRIYSFNRKEDGHRYNVKEKRLLWCRLGLL